MKVKVKIFKGEVDKVQDSVNDFIQDISISVTDIKISSSDRKTCVMVIYE